MTSQYRRRGSSAMRTLYTACSAAALIAGLAVAAPSASAQQTTPGDANCPIVAGVATCTGNLTDGVSYQIGDPDNGAGTLIVENPIGPIAPNGIYGVGIDRGDRDMTVIVRDGVVINTVDDQGVVEPAQGIIAIVRNGFDLTLDSGATINADGVTQAIAGLEGVVFGGSAELDITNRGNITVATGNHFSVGIAANNNSSTGGVTVNNSGTLNASSTAVGERDSIVSGILVSSAAGATVDVTNTGNINVTTAPGSFDTNFQGEATGIIVNALADTSATTITNSGTLTGTGPNAGGIVGFTRNNNASAPSTVVINNTGAINLNSNDSYGILIQSAGANANLTVDNDAEIAMINGLNSNGIMALGQSAAGTFSLDNSATISGSGTDYMRGVGISTSGAPANGTYTFDIENSGNITFDTPYAHGLTMFSSLGDNVTATLNNTGNIDLASTTTDFSAGIRAVLNGAAGGETATGNQTLTVTNSGDITMGAGNAMLLSGTTVNLTNSGDLSAAGAIPTVDITANTGTANFNNASVTATGANSFAFRQAGSGAYTVNVGAGSLLSATGAGGTGIGMAAEGGTTINIDGTIRGTLAAIRANANVNGNDVINNNEQGRVEGDLLTGGGNDVINNLGVIDGDVFMGDGDDTYNAVGINLVTGSIDTGAGNDTINLTPLSTVDGPLLMGAGDDLLNVPFLGQWTTPDGGAGTDTIRMTFAQGASVSMDISAVTAENFEVIEQNGSGRAHLVGTNAWAMRYDLNGGQLDQDATLANMDFRTAAGTQLNLGGTIRSLDAAGRVTLAGAAPSTINMSGNVVFQPGSIYDVRIAPGGVSDRINATGTATINGGTVNALVGAGTYVAGDAFTILNAQGGVTGMFSGLTQVSTAFLDISLVYLPNAVQIQLAPNRVDFTDFDLTFNQSQSSIPIDMFDQSAGTDTRSVSSEFLFLNTDQVAPALDNVSGELHASVLAAGMRSARSLMAAADARVNTKPGLSFWGGVAYNDNSIDGDGNASSVSSTGYTAMAGGDWTFGEVWAGALLGLTQSETEIFSGADSADNDAWTVGGYAGIGGNGSGLSARANAAWSTGEVDASRTIAFGGLNRVASSTYDLDTISASAEVRYGFFEQSGGFHWGPIAAVDYANVERGSFTETGADSLNLAGDDDAVSRFNYGAGGFVNWSGPGMTLDASLLWDQRDGDYTQTALRMTGLPGITYSVRSPETDSSGLRLSARGEFEVGDGWSLGAGYQGGFGGGEDSHAALVTLTLR